MQKHIEREKGRASGELFECKEGIKWWRTTSKKAVGVFEHCCWWCMIWWWSFYAMISFISTSTKHITQTKLCRGTQNYNFSLKSIMVFTLYYIFIEDGEVKVQKWLNGWWWWWWWNDEDYDFGGDDHPHNRSVMKTWVMKMSDSLAITLSS